VFVHGSLEPWFKRAHPLKHFKKWLFWPWGPYRVLRDAHAVLFTTDQERLLARESFWLYRCNEVVVPYGVSAPPGDSDRQTEAFYSAFPESRGRRFLLFLGRLHKKKGCELLFHAFSHISESRPGLLLVMAGPDYGEQNKLQRLAAQLRIDSRIVWAGMLRGDVKWGAFRAAEAFVLPSHSENFGVAVAESLACGCPVLISDKVGIGREVKNFDAGLVAPDTLQGTLEILRTWINLPPADRECYRHQSVECFRQCFEVQSAAAALRGIIEQALTEKGGRGLTSLTPGGTSARI
jgi:glycosyltransferase involved in cell wall biosynthesis